MQLDAVDEVVRHIESAIDFDNQIFERLSTLRSETFSGFDLSGGLFGLFASQSLNKTVDTHSFAYGNNCVANIRVADIESHWERIAALDPPHLTEIQRTGRYDLFQLEDADGNRVEFYESHRGKGR